MKSWRNLELHHPALEMNEALFLLLAGPQTGDGGIVPGRRVRGSRVADADDVLWVCVSLCRVVQGAGCAWTVRSAIYLPIGSARRSTRERGHPAGAAIPPEQREA